MADTLTEEQIAELKTAYRSHCKDDETPLPTKELGTVVRHLGFFPTEAEVALMVEEGDTEGMGWVEIADFLDVMAKRIKEPVDDKEDIKAAFRVFDRKSNGFLSAAELKHILTTIGEFLNDEEIDELIRQADVDSDGQINYEDFVNRMMAK